MGLIRKAMSVSTLGLVSYRNGSERQAAAIRKQAAATRMLATQQAVQALSEKADRERDAALRLREVETAERKERADALHNYHMWAQTAAGQAFLAWADRQKATCETIRTFDNPIQEAWRDDCRDIARAHPYDVDPAALKEPGSLTPRVAGWTIFAFIFGFIAHTGSGSPAFGLAVTAAVAITSGLITVTQNRRDGLEYARALSHVSRVRAERTASLGGEWDDNFERVDLAWLAHWKSWRGANCWLEEILEKARSGDYPELSTLDELDVRMTAGPLPRGGTRLQPQLANARANGVVLDAS